MTVALVGSPIQLVTLAEAVHAGHVSRLDRLFSQIPAADAGLVAEMVGPVLPAPEPVRAGRVDLATLRVLATAETLVLGDLFSALGQLSSLSPRVRRLVVLEDGAATLRGLRNLAEGAEVTRAHDRRAATRALARLFGWRHRRRGSGSVVAVAALPVDRPGRALLADGAIELRSHRFEWLRSVAPSALAGVVDDRVLACERVVLGAALAADGHVGVGRYHDWLRRTVTPGTLFWPHRRELPTSLELARESGAVIGPSGIPVEVLVAARPGISEIVSLPSTAVLTAGLCDPDVVVRCDPVAPSWWTPGTPDPMVELFDEIYEASAGQ